jgi:multidrug efflux pump
MPNDIYFQIGLITLVGLAAKNAILIVEFASQKMEAGMPVAQAALEAARMRFRPIVMTSMAFVLGIVPLVLATGAGAAARRSMGTGVFGGMLLATFVATIFIPLFFTWLSNTHVDRKHHDVPFDDAALNDVNLDDVTFLDDETLVAGSPEQSRSVQDNQNPKEKI